MKLLCSEMGYKEIANKMGIHDSECMKYTQILCQKLKVRGRFGLMLYALKTKIVKPNEIKFKKLQGRLTLPEGFKVVIGGTMLLEGKSDVLREDEEKVREAYEANVQKRFSHY